MDNIKILIIVALSLLSVGLVYMIMTQKESFSSCEFDNFNSEPMDDYVRGANVEDVSSAPACVAELKMGGSEPGPTNVYSSSPKKILDDEILAVGGRVLNFVSISDNYLDSRNKAINQIKKLNWKNGFYRSDIGYKVIDK